jgi:hypothetical protein
MFDNSQNHHAKKQDALVANRLNLGDGGLHTPKVRNTTYTNTLGETVVQLMQNEHGQPKGIKTILKERNLWNSIMSPPKHKCSPSCSGIQITDGIYCCALRCLQDQPDFKNQKEWITEIVEGRNHMIDFFPKYHCELSFIEMIWGRMKRLLRANCEFSFESLRNNLNKLLQGGIEQDIFAKAATYCFRFMDGYHKTMSGPLLDYAMKKYSSHRSFPSHFVVQEFEALYAVHLKSLTQKEMKKCN